MNLRRAWRPLAKSPGFGAVAVILIALGIDLSVCAFSVTNCLLVQPPPFSHPKQLVRVYRTSTRSKIVWLSAANFIYLRRHATAIADAATFVPHPRNVTEKGHLPDPENGLFVTANFFRTLGIRPLLGRLRARRGRRARRHPLSQRALPPHDAGAAASRSGS